MICVQVFVMSLVFRCIFSILHVTRKQDGDFFAVKDQTDICEDYGGTSLESLPRCKCAYPKNTTSSKEDGNVGCYSLTGTGI